MTDQHLVDLSAERPAPVYRLVEWNPWPFNNSSLIDHCSISFQGGWKAHAIPVFDGSLSVGSPPSPELDRAGRVRVNQAGKCVYATVISFEGSDTRERWNRAILAALAAGGIGPGREEAS